MKRMKVVLKTVNDTLEEDDDLKEGKDDLENDKISSWRKFEDGLFQWFLKFEKMF